MTIPPEAPLPPTTDAPPTAEERTERPRPGGEQLRNLSSLRRTTHASAEGRHIAGVAGGIAHHLDIDPLLVRVLLVVSVFFGGAGGIVYVAAWLLAPEEGSEDGVLPVGPPARNLLLWIAAAIAAVSMLGDAFGDTDIPWFWLAVLGVVAIWYANREKWTGGRTGSAPGGDPTSAPAGGATEGDGTAPPGPGVPDRTRYLPAPWTPGTYDPTAPILTPGRRRPPLLFGRAVAVAALVVGLLGLADVAGWMAVPASAYPAALLAVFGGFLVLGAFWGRAGGLILLGVIALIALPLTVLDPSKIETASNIETHPRSVAALESSYSVDAGTITLDLSDIDPKTLGGRDLEVTGSLVELTVIVPDDATVSVEATIDSLGEAKVFDETRSDLGGFVLTRTHHAGEDGSKPGTVTDADLNVTTAAELGAINVFEESDPRAVPFTDSSERSTP